MKFLIGKSEEFIDFLNSINKKDRIAVISHTDLDGVASALLITELLKDKKLKIYSLHFIDYKNRMLKEIHEKLTLEKISKIFILDINASSDYEEFENFRKEFDLFLIDHHPFDVQEKTNIIKTKTEDCTTFVLYEIGKNIINLDKWKPLVCSTMISEFSFNFPENLEFIKSIYPEINKENILTSVPAALSQKITSALIFFRGKEKKVLNLLLKNKLKKFEKYHKIIEEEIKHTLEKFKKEAEYYPEKNLYFYYYTPKFNINSIIATILSIEKKEKTFILVSNVESKKEFVTVSSRNQSGNVDLNELMKKGINGFEDASAGGHIKASGAVFMKRDLEKFKKNILE